MFEDIGKFMLFFSWHSRAPVDTKCCGASPRPGVRPGSSREPGGWLADHEAHCPARGGPPASRPEVLVRFAGSRAEVGGPSVPVGSAGGVLLVAICVHLELLVRHTWGTLGSRRMGTRWNARIDRKVDSRGGHGDRCLAPAWPRSP